MWHDIGFPESRHQKQGNFWAKASGLIKSAAQVVLKKLLQHKSHFHHLISVVVLQSRTFGWPVGY
jgi:beta-lactamase class D